MAAGPVPVNRLAVACGVLGLLAVLAAAVEGTASPTAAPTQAPAPPPPPVRDRPSPTPSLGLPSPPPHPSSGAAVLERALLVAVVVVVLVLALLVLRRLWQRRSRWARPPAPTLLTGDAARPVAQGDAPVVRRGIARALDVLAEDRLPGDAVVQAWLGLEQAAEDSGTPRARAETPTEFTARLLGRVPADRDAVRTLLGLYSRARFAARGGDPADAVRARAALQVLERSWQHGGPR